MARLMSASFETGAAMSEDMNTLTGLTFATDKAKTQTRSLKRAAATSSALAIWTVVGSTNRTYYLRSNVWLASGRMTDDVVLFELDAPDGSNGGVVLVSRDDGKLYAALYNTGGDSGRIDCGAFPFDQWVCVEAAFRINSSGNDTLDIRVNGAAVGRQVSYNVGSTAPARFVLSGNDAAGVDLWYGDFCFNDDTETGQNTWAGPGQIYLQLPVGDNAVGTGWQKPGGATTNLWSSLDNTPPAGVADTTSSGSAERQVRNAISTATGNLDLNMVDYATLGIRAGDTINVMRPIAITGSDNSTDTAGELEAVSNPSARAWSMTTFDNGVAGTFPSGWRYIGGTYVYGPSVTLGTSPVLRLGKRTATTRVALACMVAVLIDVTPGSGSGAAISVYDGSRWTDCALNVYDGSRWTQAAGLAVTT